MEHRHTERQFIAVKAVVFATFWQSVLLAGLAHYDIITATAVWSKEEITTGLCNFIICIEMFFVAIVHRWVYGDDDYIADPSDVYVPCTDSWCTTFRQLFSLRDFVEHVVEDFTMSGGMNPAVCPCEKCRAEEMRALTACSADYY